MKKKLLILSLVWLGLVWGVMYFYSPDVEVYGQTVVQFDEKTGNRFVEITLRQDIEPSEKIAVGMPVSYAKTSRPVFRVSSKVRSLEEMAEEGRKDTLLGCLVGGIISWCLAAFYIWHCHKV